MQIIHWAQLHIIHTHKIHTHTHVTEQQFVSLLTNFLLHPYLASLVLFTLWRGIRWGTHFLSTSLLPSNKEDIPIVILLILVTLIVIYNNYSNTQRFVFPVGRVFWTLFPSFLSSPLFYNKTIKEMRYCNNFVTLKCVYNGRDTKLLTIITVCIWTMSQQGQHLCLLSPPHHLIIVWAIVEWNNKPGHTPIMTTPTLDLASEGTLPIHQVLQIWLPFLFPYVSYTNEMCDYAVR